MANDKQLHPELIKNAAQVDNVAPGAFYFFGSSYKSLSLFPSNGLEIKIPTASEIVEHIPRILETYSPAACLYIFEEAYRSNYAVLHEEQKEQLSALRTAYLNILHNYSSKPHVRELAYSSKLMRSDDKNFIPEFKTDIALNLKLGFKAENTVTLEDILADLAAHPQNADFYLNPESFFRGNFVNNPQIIEHLIQLNKPEVYRAIRIHGLIDTIKYRWWKRSALYAALEEAEKLASVEFILHRYFDALDLPQKGYYARRRFAIYKAEAEQLPVEFKVEFLLKNPSKVVGFFYDERFVKELINRRPDLFFKLIRLKELTTSDAFKGKLFVSPNGFAGKLVEAAIRVGSFEEIKYLELQLEGLSWTVERYPGLREKIQEAKEKARKEEKGKPQVVVSSSSITTAKIELSDITLLDEVLRSYQGVNKLEIYMGDRILLVDFSPLQKKGELRRKAAGIKVPISVFAVDSTETVYFPEQFSIGACSISTTYISTEKLQQAYAAKVSPTEITIKPLGFFARLGQWFSTLRKSQVAQKPAKPAAVQITSSAGPSTKKTMMLVSDADASYSVEDTDSAEDQHQPKEFKSSPAWVNYYGNARKAFIHGRFEEALRYIDTLMVSMQGQYGESAEVTDEGSLRTLLLVKILREANATVEDYLMVDELAQQKLSDALSRELTDLRAAIVYLLGEFDYKTIKMQTLSKEWHGSFQLFLLERQFLDLHENKNTIAYKRAVLGLQKRYMCVLEQHSGNPLAKAMAAGSRLVSYQTSYDVAKSRVTVMGMFERDPFSVIKQMFLVLEQNNLSDPSQFITQVVAKVELRDMMSYVQDFYPAGLEILIKTSKHFCEMLFESELKLTGLVRGVCPEIRHILRRNLPKDKFLNVKRALKEQLDEDVNQVLSGTKDFAEKKFADPFFVEEIEANLDAKQQIVRNDEMYDIYKKYGYNYLDGIEQLFDKYVRNENLPEDLIVKIIEQAGVREVLNCIIKTRPCGLRILLEKYPAAREILKAKESYLQALASSEFPEVRQTLRQCGFELSEKVKQILARKVRKNVEAITEQGKTTDRKTAEMKAREKLNDTFFVAELFLPENAEELKTFEAKFPGLLYRVTESQAQSQVRASLTPSPF